MTALTFPDVSARSIKRARQTVVPQDRPHALLSGGGYTYVAPVDTPAPGVDEVPGEHGWKLLGEDAPVGHAIHDGVGEMTVGESREPDQRLGSVLWAIVLCDPPRGVTWEAVRAESNRVMDALRVPHALLFRGEPDAASLPLLDGQVYVPRATFSQYLGEPWELLDDGYVSTFLPLLFHAAPGPPWDWTRTGVFASYETSTSQNTSVAYPADRERVQRILEGAS